MNCVYIWIGNRCERYAKHSKLQSTNKKIGLKLEYNSFEFDCSVQRLNFLLTYGGLKNKDLKKS